MHRRHHKKSILAAANLLPFGLALAFLFLFGVVCAVRADYYFYLVDAGGFCPAGTVEYTEQAWGMFDAEQCPHGTIEANTDGGGGAGPLGGADATGSFIYLCVENGVVGGGPCGGICGAGGGGAKLCFSGTPPVFATSISLDKSSLTINVGATETLSATVLPINASDKTVSWASSNPAAATVDSGGLVSAKAGGVAIITATTSDGTKRQASCLVMAKVPVTGVGIIGCPPAVIEKGDTYNLTAIVSPSNATFQDVFWSSSSNGVVSVKDGAVKAVSSGEATITLTAVDNQTKTATCVIAVHSALTGISMSSFTISTVGSTYTPTPGFSPSDASNKAVTWNSDNTTVATVNSSGVVTAKKEGQAKITATSVENSSVKGSATVTVPAQAVYASAVSLSCPSSVDKNSSKPGSFSFSNNPTSWYATISSGNTNIASVSPTSASSSKTFTIYGNGPGDTTITVRESYGGKSATCPITVPYPIHHNLKSVCGDAYIKGSCSGHTYSGGSQNGTFSITSCPGTIYGSSKCSTTEGTPNKQGKLKNNDSGQHCWCQLKSGSASSTSGGAWVYKQNLNSKSNCEKNATSGCANWCGNDARYSGLDFHAALCGPDGASYPIHPNLTGTVCYTQNPGYIDGTYSGWPAYESHWYDEWVWDWLNSGMKTFCECRIKNTSTGKFGKYVGMGEIGATCPIWAWINVLGCAIAEVVDAAVWGSGKDGDCKYLCANVIASCPSGTNCTPARAQLCGPE